jgi:hypothetical protein
MAKNTNNPVIRKSSDRQDNAMVSQMNSCAGGYEVGQILNIGYYGGFHNTVLIKKKAIITNIDSRCDLIYIRIALEDNDTDFKGPYRKMFGYASDLKLMEENYQKPTRQ